MDREPRYHELKETAKDMLNGFFEAIDRRFATPKHIVDCGKSERAAQSVQSVVAGLGAISIERAEIAQLPNTVERGWTDMGEYLERE